MAGDVERRIGLLRTLTDEELFLVGRHERPFAENELCRRYLQYKQYYLKFISEQNGIYLDEWAKADAFINALAISVKKFKTKTNCLFKTFFVSVLRNELRKERRESNQTRGISSLESHIGEEDSGLCLCDVIPVDETPDSSPALYACFGDVEDAIKSLRRDQQWVVRGLVRYLSLGSSMVSAAKEMGISYGRARYAIGMLAEEMKKRGFSI